MVGAELRPGGAATVARWRRSEFGHGRHRCCIDEWLDAGSGCPDGHPWGLRNGGKLDLVMLMDVPMVHRVANIAKGRFWICDYGGLVTARAALGGCKAAFGRQRFRCFGVCATYGAARGPRVLG
jgi:hypothetical protein